MAKQLNHRGKYSHCSNAKIPDPELIKLWQKKLQLKKGKG